MIRYFPFAKKNKVALVLGGGVARGLAHIGVLKVLNREKIIVDMVVGTSIGALIGAAYCAGHNLSSLEKKAQKMSWKDLFDFGIPRLGLMEGKKLERLIREEISNLRFEDLKIPLAVVTTDINNGVEVIHTKGLLWPVIKASCSIPGLFNPVRVDKKLLVDGGVLHNVPAKIARDLGADKLIAVDVGYYIKKGEMKNIWSVFLQAWHLRGKELGRYQNLHAEILIKVNLPGVSPVDFQHSKECIRQGELATEKKIPQIKKLLRIK